MKQFHDLSFLATWVGWERWADTQWAGCFNSTVCSERRQTLKLSQYLIIQGTTKAFRWKTLQVAQVFFTVVSFTPQPLYPRYPLHSGLGGPQSPPRHLRGKTPWSIQPVVQLVGQPLYLLNYPEPKNSEHAASNTTVSGSPNRADNYAQ